MARILACIDSSSYGNSVCDHAGWFASDPDIGVEVLHVAPEIDAPEASNDPSPADATAVAADALVERGVWRLREEGVGPVTSALLKGSFVEVAAQRGAEVIVMGKRGEASHSERSRLGSNVEAMINATATPVCLTSKLYLPIRRGLVLLDADMEHRGAVDFVVEEPRLADLPMDIVVMFRPDQAPDRKVALARRVFASEGRDVFTLQADGLNDAITQHMESRAADLVVVSRQIIEGDPGGSLSRIDEQGLWGMRTPILIC